MEAMAHLDPFSSMIYDDLHIYIYDLYDIFMMIYIWFMNEHYYDISIFRHWNDGRTMKNNALLRWVNCQRFTPIYIYGDHINAIIQSHL